VEVQVRRRRRLEGTVDRNRAAKPTEAVSKRALERHGHTLRVEEAKGGLRTTVTWLRLAWRRWGLGAAGSSSAAVPEEREKHRTESSVGLNGKGKNPSGSPESLLAPHKPRAVV
jgi:hypothetical protein